MKILFVYSGNKTPDNPVIINQIKSLVKNGIQVDVFRIKGSGILGYLKNLILLNKSTKAYAYDLVHSHYLFSSLLTSLTFKKPHISSLMGSDIFSSWVNRILFRILHMKGWDYCIIKSEIMKELTGLSDNIAIVPNGVDFDKFQPVDKKDSQISLNWDIRKKHILFAANIERSEKNYLLLKKSLPMLTNYEIELHVLKNVNNENVPVMMNASDVVILTSKWEGSPNVIKEAMACNRPVVCTKVGDVEWLFGGESGHYLTEFDEVHVAYSLQKAIEFSLKGKTTNGRSRLKELGLDSDSVARKIITIYKKLIY